MLNERFTTNTSLNVIVDIQEFKDNENYFISKKVAVVALIADFIGHWITASAYLFINLPQTICVQNYWLSRSCNSIKWFDGVVPSRGNFYLSDNST